jgi:prepilin-type N-terminal cleavage/methylation domain-containing protein
VRKKAFTLVELVMVMVILGIISAGAYMLSLNSVPQIKVDVAAKKVVNDLEYARNLALVNAKWYGVIFQVAPTNTYTVYLTDGTTDTPVSNPAKTNSQLVVDLASDYSGVTISAVNISGGNKVEFNPLGTPYDDKTGAALAANGTLTLSLSGRTRTIQITPSTGEISIL